MESWKNKGQSLLPTVGTLLLSTSNPLHFLPPAWTQWGRHSCSSLQLICSQASAVFPFWCPAGWGLCSVTFKQDHSPPRVLGPIYTHYQALVEATACTVPEVLNACTNYRQISHTPCLPLQRRERPKSVVLMVKVMNMNSLRILRISLKDQLFTVWQVDPTSTECYWQRTHNKHARHTKSTIWTCLC